MFELSEHLWWISGLILNVIFPLLPSCWGFSFALGHEVSPQSCSSMAKSLLQCLASCWGFSTLGHGVSPHSHSSATQPSLQHLECPGVSGRGMGWQCPAAGLGALSVAVHSWELLKEVTIIFITSTIVWPQVQQKGGNTALSPE